MIIIMTPPAGGAGAVPGPLEGYHALPDSAVDGMIPQGAADVPPPPPASPIYEYSSEFDIVEVTDTSVATSVPSTYACNLRYRYNCLYGTTLGPQLCSASFAPWAVRFLDRYSTIQGAFYKRFGYLALFIITAAVQVVTTAYSVSPVIIGLLLLPILIVMCATLVLDTVLLAAMEPAMSVAWPAGMIFQRDHPNLKDGNAFKDIDHTNIKLWFATDLTTHIFAAQLRRYPTLHVMVYSPKWKLRFVPFYIGMCQCNTLIASCAGERYFWLVTAAIVDLGATLHIAINVPGVAPFAGVVPALMLLFMLSVIHVGTRYFRTLASAVLCFLPDLLFNSYHEGLRARIIALAHVAMTAGTSAPKLGWQ